MNEDEKNNLFPDYPLTEPLSREDDIPLTSDGSDDNFFLTGEGEETFLTGSGEEPAEEPAYRRPMFNRVQPPSERERGTLSRPDSPPIPRPSRLDPNLLNRTRRPRHGETRATDRPPSARIPRPRKIATRKKNFAILYIFALMAVIAGGLTLFVYYFPTMQESAARETPSPTPTAPPEVLIPPDARNMLGQITRIVTAARTVELLRLSDGTRHTFTYTENTEMTNIHGNPMVFEQLAVGQLVDISFDARTNYLFSAHQSRNAWERRNQTNLRFDFANDTITVGNDVFTFSHHQTMVLYRGIPFPIASLQSINTVTLLGYGDHIWLIQLVEGHGFLQIINADRVINGHIEIGQISFLPLHGFQSEVLPEGQHSIVVTGQNIETFVQTIEISQGEIFILNLNETVLLTGLMHINVTPPDAFVYINGELRSGTGPVRLDFGEHLIRVESYGYFPVEQTINVTGTVGNITFELQEVVRTGTIRIMTIPTNAQIFVDNQFVGHSELFHELPLGTYTITARLAGHDEVTIPLEVVPGETERTLLLLPTPVMPTPTPTPTPPPDDTPPSDETPPPYQGDPFATPPPIGGPPAPPPLG